MALPNADFGAVFPCISFARDNSMKAERTLAVQIPAELFERLKEYLVAHNLKQKQFLIQLIESALEDTEKE